MTRLFGARGRINVVISLIGAQARHSKWQDPDAAPHAHRLALREAVEQKGVLLQRCDATYGRSCAAGRARPWIHATFPL